MQRINELGRRCRTEGHKLEDVHQILHITDELMGSKIIFDGSAVPKRYWQNRGFGQMSDGSTTVGARNVGENLSLRGANTKKKMHHKVSEEGVVPSLNPLGFFI
jgi:hypothetical protein